MAARALNGKLQRPWGKGRGAGFVHKCTTPAPDVGGGVVVLVVTSRVEAPRMHALARPVVEERKRPRRRFQGAGCDGRKLRRAVARVLAVAPPRALAGREPRRRGMCPVVRGARALACMVVAATRRLVGCCVAAGRPADRRSEPGELDDSMLARRNPASIGRRRAPESRRLVCVARVSARVRHARERARAAATNPERRGQRHGPMFFG